MLGIKPRALCTVNTYSITGLYLSAQGPHFTCGRTEAHQDEVNSSESHGQWDLVQGRYPGVWHWCLCTVPFDVTDYWRNPPSWVAWVIRKLWQFIAALRLDMAIIEQTRKPIVRQGTHVTGTIPDCVKRMTPRQQLPIVTKTSTEDGAHSQKSTLTKSTSTWMKCNNKMWMGENW